MDVSLTMGCNLPTPGILDSQMFYFNIAGSMKQNHVKLMALLSNVRMSRNGYPIDCVYFDNDKTQTWKKKEESKCFQFPHKYHINHICLDFWVLLFCFCFLFLCLSIAGSLAQK